MIFEQVKGAGPGIMKKLKLYKKKMDIAFKCLMIEKIN